MAGVELVDIASGLRKRKLWKYGSGEDCGWEAAEGYSSGIVTQEAIEAGVWKGLWLGGSWQ